MEKRLLLLLFVAPPIFIGMIKVSEAVALPEITKPLTVGDTDVSTGGEVSLWQKFLIEEGYLKIQKSTGFFLRLTAKATEEWQKNKGISPTAPAVGPKTRAKLRALKEQAFSIAKPSPPSVEPETPPVVPAAEASPTAEPTPVPEPPACRTRKVPDEYSTIKDAIANACEGDLILLAPKTYSENVIISKNNLTIKSEEGSSAAVLQPERGQIITVMPEVSAFTAEGLTLVGNFESIGIYAVLPDTRLTLNVKNFIIKNTSTGISVLTNSGNISIRNSLFADNKFYGVYDRVSGTGVITLENNTFAKSDIGFYVDSSGGTHRSINNIFASHRDNAIAIASTGTNQEENILNVSYTNSWNSTDSNYYSYRENAAFTPVGTNNFSTDPIFLSDYRLNRTSPMIDTGSPASPLDPDGTRADIGAYPVDQRLSQSGDSRHSFLASLISTFFGWMR